jgi:hypothetical protein
MTLAYERPARMTPEETVNALTLLMSSRKWISTLSGAPKVGIEGDPLLARFNYKNWKGEEHVYTVLAESVEYMMYNLYGEENCSEPRWVLNAQVGERSGVRKPYHRRTFALAALRDLKLVNEEGQEFIERFTLTAVDGKKIGEEVPTSGGQPMTWLAEREES